MSEKEKDKRPPITIHDKVCKTCRFGWSEPGARFTMKCKHPKNGNFALTTDSHSTCADHDTAY